MLFFLVIDKKSRTCLFITYINTFEKKFMPVIELLYCFNTTKDHQWNNKRWGRLFTLRNLTWSHYLCTVNMSCLHIHVVFLLFSSFFWIWKQEKYYYYDIFNKEWHTESKWGTNDFFTECYNNSFVIHTSISAKDISKILYLRKWILIH